MQIKINTSRPVVMQSRKSAPLFKDGKTRTKIMNYSATNVMKSSHFNSIQNFVLKIVDKMAPVMSKYPKIESKIMKLTENMLRKTKELSERVK